MTTQTTTQQSFNASAAFQGQQGGGPIIAGVSDDKRPLKTYGDQLVIFVADNSGSMSGEKANEASQAIAICLKELADPTNKDGFRASVISYGSSAHVLHSASDPTQANARLDGNGGGTSLAPALNLAQGEISSYDTRPNRTQQPAVVIIFSDGQLADGQHAENEADTLKKMGAKIIAVGFGSDADEEQLRRLATAPDHYSFADIGQLKSLFSMVGKTLSQQHMPAS